MKWQNKKGQVSSYIIWFIGAVIIVTIGAVLAPLGVNFNTQMYLAGEDILEQTEPDIALINDATIKAQVNESLQAAKDSAAHNINVNNNLFQYSWVLFLVISTLIIFATTRQIVQFQQRGGFI